MTDLWESAVTAHMAWLDVCDTVEGLSPSERQERTRETWTAMAAAVDAWAKAAGEDDPVRATIKVGWESRKRRRAARESWCPHGGVSRVRCDECMGVKLCQRPQVCRRWAKSGS